MRAARRASLRGVPLLFGRALVRRTHHGLFPKLRAIAMLRNPVDRTLSAFPDRHPLGYHKLPGSGRERLEPTLRGLLARLGSSGNGSNAIDWEDRDLRLVTNGIYLYGLRHWASLGAPLLLVRMEDLLARPGDEVARVQNLLGLSRTLPPSALATHYNQKEGHTMVREQPTAALRRLLGCFFAPHNEALYAWAARRGTPLTPWPSEPLAENATACRALLASVRSGQ